MNLLASWLSLVSIATATAAANSESSFQAKCEALKDKIHIDSVKVNFTQFIAAGNNVSVPTNPVSCGNPEIQPVYGNTCRVRMSVATSSASQLTVEAWLPQNFTGRFLSTGNGGLGGCFQYYNMAYGAGLGFATVGTNTGHDGTSGAPFLNHPETIADFAYRSVHVSATVGKQVTDYFYGANSRKKSYYLGCSTGGRQGQKSAEICRVSSLQVPKFAIMDLWLNVVTGFDNTTAGFITEPLWTLIHNEILRQCDGLDGAVDGIIEDPDLCNPDFTTLLCGTASISGGNVSNCLSGEQMTKAQTVFTPLYGPNNTLWYPRMQPGSELEAYLYNYAGIPYQYSVDWFRYVVYNDSTWDPTKVTYQDFANAIAQDPSNIETFSSSLADFQKSGGKLITFHGMQDDLISSDISELYYKTLSAGMDLPPRELDSFYRYFRISGMYHCGSGPGAWSIGWLPIEGVIGDPTMLDPQDNVLLAVVDWVEKGNAPEYLRGTKYNNDTVSDGVAFRRKHCKFPARNVYVGPGNYTDEDAWKCVLYQGQESIKQLPSSSLYF